MDLGRDTPGLCHQTSYENTFLIKNIFRFCWSPFSSKSVPTPYVHLLSVPSDVRTPVSRFCLKTFVLPSWSLAIPEFEAFIKKAPITECSWSPQPNTFLVDTQFVNTVPLPSGVGGIFGQEIEKMFW